MGKLTCTVMIGFLALHLAEIFLLLAIATPEWLKGDLNATHADNGTVQKITKGLWRICDDDNCTRLNQTMQEKWFHAVQGLDIGGVGLGMMALIVTYAMLLGQSCKTSGPAAMANTFIQLVAAASTMTALIIFAVKAKKNIITAEFPDEYVMDFHWSFFVDIPGVVLLWLSALMSIRVARHNTTRRDGYEDI